MSDVTDTNRRPLTPDEKRKEDLIKEAMGVMQTSIARTNRILQSDFESKYSILYNKNLREQLLKHELSDEDQNKLQAIAKDFYDKIDARHPISVVNDITEEVVYTLPPIFAQLRPLEGEETLRVDVFNNITNREGQLNDPRSRMRVNQASRELNQALAYGQDVNDLRAQRERFKQTAMELNQKVNHPEMQAQQQVEEKFNQIKDDLTDKVDAEMEFAPVEDDE